MLGGNFWTPERDEQLKLMWEAGVTLKKMALNIGHGCTHNMVSRHVRALGLSPRPKPRGARSKPRPTTKTRACMSCGETFESAGIQNRLCSACSRKG